MEALGFDEFPESLNEIQVGRVSRQPQERDVKAFRLRHDKMIALVHALALSPINALSFRSTDSLAT